MNKFGTKNILWLVFFGASLLLLAIYFFAYDQRDISLLNSREEIFSEFNIENSLHKNPSKNKEISTQTENRSIRISGNCKFGDRFNLSEVQTLETLAQTEAQFSGQEFLPENEKILNFTASWKVEQNAFRLNLYREIGDLGIYSYNFQKKEMKDLGQKAIHMKEDLRFWEGTQQLNLDGEQVNTATGSQTTLSQVRKKFDLLSLSNESSNLLSPRLMRLQKSAHINGELQSVQVDFEGVRVQAYNRIGVACFFNQDTKMGDSWQNCICN